MVARSYRRRPSGPADASNDLETSSSEPSAARTARPYWHPDQALCFQPRTCLTGPRVRMLWPTLRAPLSRAFATLPPPASTTFSPAPLAPAGPFYSPHMLSPTTTARSAVPSWPPWQTMSARTDASPSLPLLVAQLLVAVVLVATLLVWLRPVVALRATTSRATTGRATWSQTTAATPCSTRMTSVAARRPTVAALPMPIPLTVFLWAGLGQARLLSQVPCPLRRCWSQTPTAPTTLHSKASMPRRQSCT